MPPARRTRSQRPADRPLGRRRRGRRPRRPRTEPLQLDVTDPASIAAAARQVAERYGRLDVLVNNAAITYDTWQRAVDADLAVVREAAETNLYGPWLMVQQFLPLLRASEHPRIVNVSSEAASLASMGGGTPAYTASKVALNALTRMLAAELRRDHVLVNAVCPGWVATDMGGPGGRPVEDRRRQRGLGRHPARLRPHRRLLPRRPAVPW